MTTEDKLNDLTTAIGHVMTFLEAQSVKREDDSLLLQSLVGKIEIQGQRLHKVCTDLGNMKDQAPKPQQSVERRTQLSEASEFVDASERLQPEPKLVNLNTDIVAEIVKNVKSETMEFASNIKKRLDNIAQVSYVHHNDVIDKVNKLEKAVTPKLEIIEKTANECKREVSNLTMKMSNIEQSSNDLTMKMSNIEKSNNDIRVKVLRVTTVSAVTNTKLKEDMILLNNEVSGLRVDLQRNETNVKYTISKSEQDRSEIDDKLKTLSEIKPLTSLFGKIDDLKKKLDSMAETENKQLSVVEKLKVDLDKYTFFNKIVSEQGRAVIDQVITEGQITRAVIQQTTMERPSYSCEFHVVNFSRYEGSMEFQYSRLWYIPQAKTYVKGCVLFKRDKSLEVWLAYGCYPRTLGLEPRSGGRLNVKVTVVKQGQTGHNMELGSTVIRTDEKDIGTRNDGWVAPRGYRVASVSCDEIKSRGFLDNDKIAMSYDITVL